MNHYTLEEIIKRWGKEELTNEQAIGQILLIMKGLSHRIGQLEKKADQQRKANGEEANASPK